MYRPHDDTYQLPGPTVYRLASERRYGEIPKHVEARPQDIYWADRYQSTALHVLCCSRQVGDPLLRAVDSILERDPGLVGRPNDATWTPLHLACEKRLLWRNNVATTDLVTKLIAACPEAVSLTLQTGYKAKTPFHISCETNASEEVLRAMLRINPSLVGQAYHKKIASHMISENPLQILWSALMKEQRPVADFEKMELLLEAAFSGKVPATADDDEDVSLEYFPIVCAVCSIPCPRDYITRILSTHPREISRPDARGLLPLHYAVLSTDEKSSKYTAFLIEILVQEYREAASIPFGDSIALFPLHVLVADHSMTWHDGGVRQLAHASTEVLRIPDPRSRLVPALESAIQGDQSRMLLSTTYELLRLAPEVVQGGFTTASLQTFIT